MRESELYASKWDGSFAKSFLLKSLVCFVLFYHSLHVSDVLSLFVPWCILIQSLLFFVSILLRCRHCLCISMRARSFLFLSIRVYVFFSFVCVVVCVLGKAVL